MKREQPKNTDDFVFAERRYYFDPDWEPAEFRIGKLAAKLICECEVGLWHEDGRSQSLLYPFNLFELAIQYGLIEIPEDMDYYTLLIGRLNNAIELENLCKDNNHASIRSMEGLLDKLMTARGRLR